MDIDKLQEYINNSDEWRSLAVEAIEYIESVNNAIEEDWDLVANMITLTNMGNLPRHNRDDLVTILAFGLAHMARYGERQLAKGSKRCPAHLDGQLLAGIECICPPPKVVIDIPDAFKEAFEEGDLSV